MEKTDNLQELALTTLLAPATSLCQLSALKSFTEDDIHDIRVASRRLRIGLPIFHACFDSREAAQWLRTLKSLTTSLGNARDYDVFLNFLSERGVDETLLAAEKKARTAAYQTAEKKLARIAKSHVLEKMVKALEELPVKTADCYALGLANIFMRYSAVEKNSHSLTEAANKTAHHQLRIAVKKFRYSLEVFAPLFSDELQKEISALKGLQDSLGKMHDFDVFLERIPQLMRTAVFHGFNVSTLQQLEGELLTYCEETRNKLYLKTCRLWQELTAADYGRRLMIKFAEQQPLNEIWQEKLQTPKLMVVSDIHGSLAVLERALNDAICRGANGILCLGDIAGYGNTDGCLQLLLRNEVLAVHGNYDLKTAEIYWTQECFADKNNIKEALQNVSLPTLQQLLQFPAQRRLQVAGKKILMVHDSPARGKERLGPKTAAERLAYLAELAQADIVLIGHSHLPFIRQVNDTLFLNPGSLGNLKDIDARPSYALLDLQTNEAEIIKLDRDQSAVCARCLLKATTASAEAGSVTLTNSLDDVLAMAEKLQVRIPHALAVTALATNLFCQLSELHQLSEKSLLLLQKAALLHDAGWLLGKNKHERNSYKIILTLPLALSTPEQTMVAAIARYHRGKLPQKDDPELQNFNKEELAAVLKLAAILRIADELANQTENEQIDSCPLINGKLEIFLSKEHAEIKLKKDDLFEKVFGYQVEVL